MRKGWIHIACLTLISISASAQKNTPNPADFSGAEKIAPNAEYVFKVSPKGYGAVKEFRLNGNRSPYIFREERNTKWFLIEIAVSGTFSFEITPHCVSDDYDWMLFEGTPDLKDRIHNQTAIPIRSNNSRNEPREQSKTGLKEGYNNLYTRPGPNPSYSKPVQVKKGERYFLIVDNIYQNGKGFSLRGDIQAQIETPYATLHGTVRDRTTGRAVKSEIIFEDDSTSAVLVRAATDNEGRYSVSLPLDRPINGTALNRNYLYSTQDFQLRHQEKSTIDFYLDSIRAGNKMVLFNIHFEPNRDNILPHSIAELDRLVSFLKFQPGWKVKIIGHSNFNVFADSRYLQQLSLDRAISVKRFLVERGVSETRMTCYGMGGKSPLITTKDPAMGLRNLRVEVVLEGKM
mgnify:CR=1 FL=1